MFDVIRARDAHWNILREIRLRALSANPEAFGSSWEEESAFDEARWVERTRIAAWFIALDADGSPIGVVASRHEDDSAPAERELQAMWVHNSRRGEGIAATLAESVFEWARSDGAERVTLYVSPKNAPALGLYSALGFVDTGDRWIVDPESPSDAWRKLAREL